MSRAITYETPTDGFGDHATDDDRDSFCTYVELRIEETYPDYTCTASWGSALESRVRVSSDAVDAPDADELVLVDRQRAVGRMVLGRVCRPRGGVVIAGRTYTIAADSDADALEATIEERGNGFPDVGDYVPGDDGELYRVVSTDGRIQTGPAGAANWIRASVEAVEWDDCDEDAEFPAMAVLAGD